MPDTPRRPYQRLLERACNVYTLVGVVLPLVLAAIGTVEWSPSTLAFAFVLVVIGVVSGHLELEFRFGGREIRVVPDGVAWVIAAILLSPSLAMLVALASSLPSLRSGFRRELVNSGALSTTVGITSLLIHLAMPTPSPEWMLAAGLVAAVIFDALLVGEGLAYLESEERGAARAHLGESWRVAGFEIGLPTLAVGLVAPFVDHPVLALVVLSGYLGITYLGMRVLQSEQVHRSRSAYLSDTFSRYVPAAMMEQLTEEEAAVTLGGAEVEVSVMFVDVRGFTSWSEQLQPTEIVEQLNELLGACTEAIFATGGTLDKFTGDGLMAFWGAPVRQEDHARRACLAALDMLERIAALNAERAAGMPHLHLGVGIHSGTALVGNIGHSDRHDYTAIGDTVNVAARLEAATKDAGCDALVSSCTNARLAGDELLGALERVGEMQVKGRRAAVDAFRLELATAAAIPTELDRAA